jgi:hypothetical protein
VENDFGTVTASHCVIGDPSGSDITAANGNILSPASPGFSHKFLANGGPTLTLALQPGSPAQAAGGAVTTLNGAVSASTSGTIQSITVATGTAGAIASTPGSYIVQVDSEQMLVTNVNLSTDTLTVQRGYNGTPASSHNSGAGVFLATDQRGFWRSTTAPDVGAYQLSANNGVQTFVVNTAADTTGVANTISLRDAVMAAAAATAQGKSVMITFDVTKMTTPMITLSKELVLPSGTGTTTIDGGGQITINGVSSRLFTVAAGALGAITGLTVQHGSSNEGAGILNNGVLTVSKATIASNSAGAPAQLGTGGGIANETDANLTLSHVSLTNNTASNFGGGIYNGGTVTIRDSTLTNNTASAAGVAGGGILNDAGSTLTLVNDTLSGNKAPNGDGGAVFNNHATLTSTNDTFSGNTISGKGGGIFNKGGTVTSVDDTFTGNTVSADGGGLYAKDGAVTLAGDAFYGNHSFGNQSSGNNGGSLYNDGATMTLANTTVANNTAVTAGGIVNNSGTLMLTNDTVFGNTGNSFGGIYMTGGTVKLVNTIVAKNVAPFPDIFGLVADDSSNNIVGSGLGLEGISGGDNGNQVGFEGNLTDLIDPMLAPLNYYGGPTQTMALLPGSPAVRAGGAVTTLAAIVSASSSATSIPVAPGPAALIASTPGAYAIQVDGEQMLVTSVNLSTNTLTVQRGYNNTPIASHNSGAGVFLATDQRGQSRPVAAPAPAQQPDIGAFQTQPAILVTTASDAVGHTGVSLRDAITLASVESAASRAPQTVTIPSGISTITLTQGWIPVLGGTITLVTQAPVAISGNNLNKLFMVPLGVSFNLGSGSTIDTYITLERADPTFGAISNAGTLTVLNCTFADNVATVAGGAIYNTGTLIVSGSTFSGNSAGQRGGAIDNAGGVVTVTGCTFSGNTAGLTGGAIDNEAGMLTVAHSTITANSAPAGGGIWNQGTLTVIDCIISGNAGPGIGGGPLVIDDSADTGNATYTITASTVQVNGLPPITYTGAQSLTIEGGSGSDTFALQGALPGVALRIDGGGGSNTLDYSKLAGPVTVNLQTTTASGIGGTFAHISNFIGSGSSADTLIGPDVGATWDINGANSGSVNGSTFSSFEDLTGGSGADQFVFFPGGSVAGNIDGGGGSNTLDYSHLTTPVTLNLQTGMATGIGGTFAHITNFIGGSGSNALAGPNANTVWTLTGLNTISVNGLSISGFQSLVGGSGADRFVFQTGGRVSGRIDGGGGNNTLDYSPYVGDIVVDLALGTATGVGNGVSHLENVTGSIGNDLLVGDALPNTLVGGTGRNVIIGGLGADTLVGGGGDNILIGGTTAYDTNLTALAAIMAEWTRTDLSFEQRLADLNSDAPPARALNGPYELNKKTVFDDGAADTLSGGAGLDWFLYDEKLDILSNVKPRDHKTGID